MDPVEVLNTQKRSAEEASLSNHGVDKGKRPSTRPRAVPMQVDEGPSNAAVRTSQPKPRKKRTPPRRLPVKTVKRNIWKCLEQLDAGLSVAQWLSMDREAYKDIRDGLRYLYGRKPKAGQPKTIGQVNAMEVDTNASDDEDWWTDEGVSDEGDDGTSVSSIDTIESKDTNLEYPYDFSKMQSSKPLKAPIVINDEPVMATFDTGASVSVISKPLAKKLGLESNGDCLPLSSLGQASAGVGRITTHVPIRVAGKYRPEHMCIFDTDRPVCLLGMTWFKAHGVYIDSSDSTIVIPVKHGRGSVVLQGNTTSEVISTDKQEQQGEVFAVTITSGVQEEQQGDNVDIGVGIFATDATTCAMEEGGGEMEFDTSGATALLRYYKEEVLGEEHEEQQPHVIPETIGDLLNNYQHCFVEVSGLGRVKNFTHDIPLNDTTPVRSRPYRLSSEEEEHLRSELATLTDMGLIRPSKGLWTSPIFFVKKKDESLRMVIDYRELNSKTAKDAYPLPHIDDLLGAMSGACIFSTLDAASGYWQIPLADDAIERSGFVTKYGTYEFTVMPFGLTSAPACFQRTVNTILAPYIGKFAFVFIDDIIIYSRSVEEHVEHLRKVFEVCDNAGLRLKRAKCEFAKEHVEYLGHIVSCHGLLPSPRNVAKIRNMPPPRNLSQARSLVGMINYYRRHIKDCAEILAPLTKLFKKQKTFYWGPEQETAFTHLKIILTGPPLLAFPDKDQMQILTTDASTEAIGAILSQSPDGSD